MQKIRGTTRIYGIIGQPISHTFSPKMQNAAFDALNINARYVAFPVKSENIKEALAGIRALNISGINVTVPHKSSVIPFLDEITPIAKMIGAVNTIRNDQGRLSGTNTDVSGFQKSLQSLNFSANNKTVAILGAGGSARALLAGMANEGASCMLVQNRTAIRAENLVKEFKEFFPDTEIKAVTLEELQDTPLDLLINSTTVGMIINESPLDLNRCKKIENVADIIYRPSQTKLLQQADALNIPAINGLGMLLYQGCDAFTFWTGQTAPEAIMREQLLNQIE